MLRIVLITLVVLLALRAFARLTAPPPAGGAADARGSDAGARANRAAPRRPALDPAERERLEVERERALREGRQLDAIEIHRRLRRGE